MREITYVVGLLNNASRYNGTFLDGRIQVYLDFLSRYFPIRFKRINDPRIARYRIYFGAVSNPRYAAVTSASERRTTINQSFNFGRNDHYCARVLIHEFGHCLNTSFVHLKGTFDVMSETAGTAGNLTENDCKYFYAKAYGYAGSRRPWLPGESNLLASTFSNPLVRDSGNVATGEDAVCSCGSLGCGMTWRDRAIGLLHHFPRSIVNAMGLRP